MRIIFRSYKDFEKWVSQSDTVKRKLNPKCYTVIISPRGVELVPVMSTRHLHNILIETPSDNDISLVIAMLKSLGFPETLPFGVVEPIV
jgi:hypothetical protein